MLGQAKIGILAAPSDCFYLSEYFAKTWLLRMLVVPSGAFKEIAMGKPGVPPSVELEKSKLSENFGIAFYSVGFADEKVSEDGMFCKPTVDD